MDLEVALFRRFAELEPTKNAVLEFADFYGLLGNPVALEPARQGQADVPASTHGEPLETWRFHISTFARSSGSTPNSGGSGWSSSR